ncbi:hypothetical protein F2P79_024272 [Pimephales promelas]|nr:hypothetical protein F2P79_024272 [Pimephales promelas]
MIYRAKLTNWTRFEPKQRRSLRIILTPFTSEMMMMMMMRNPCSSTLQPQMATVKVSPNGTTTEAVQSSNINSHPTDEGSGNLTFMPVKQHWTGSP